MAKKATKKRKRAAAGSAIDRERQNMRAALKRSKRLEGEIERLTKAIWRAWLRADAALDKLAADIAARRFKADDFKTEAERVAAAAEP